LNLKFAKSDNYPKKKFGKNIKNPEFKFVDAGFKNAPKKVKSKKPRKNMKKRKILKVRLYIWL
jgi:hypothetical protein